MAFSGGSDERGDANPYQQLLPEGLFDQILIA